MIDFGEWDGDYSDRMPSDLDGDGVIDFVFYDNAFLYAFASYAESGAPPLVMNVVDGDVVDVSDRPGFRYLFEDALREHRQYCLRPRDMSPNGACAAYAAAAARVGRVSTRPGRDDARLRPAQRLGAADRLHRRL